MVKAMCVFQHLASRSSAVASSPCSSSVGGGGGGEDQLLQTRGYSVNLGISNVGPIVQWLEDLADRILGLAAAAAVSNPHWRAGGQASRRGACPDAEGLLGPLGWVMAEEDGTCCVVAAWGGRQQCLHRSGLQGGAMWGSGTVSGAP